jgi:hypothetical protein
MLMTASSSGLMFSGSGRLISAPPSTSAAMQSTHPSRAA